MNIRYKSTQHSIFNSSFPEWICFFGMTRTRTMKTVKEENYQVEVLTGIQGLITVAGTFQNLCKKEKIERYTFMKIKVQ